MSVRPRFALTLLTAALALAALPAAAQDYPCEVYTLPNGLTVILHEDHALPQVTVNTWFGVGSRDEAPGRTGFAHLFEHLMFMGTDRVPGGQFDIIMESGGGANNASTGDDRTNYFSFGPSSLLPTLLWLDADRLEGLGKAMTQEKLDLQRSVVRNERRQGVENAPYGIGEVALPGLLYPPGHPYDHPIIGSHEDLEAATLKDVVAFFDTWYVTGNATLVVAGDFRSDEVKSLIDKTFGAVPGKYPPARRGPQPAVMTRETRAVFKDKVEVPKLYLVWHSPAAFAPGDAEMELLGSILSKGGAGRLHKRLVLKEGLASEVAAYQYSKDLGSDFFVEVTAREGADLNAAKRAVLEELRALAQDGPTSEEVERAQAGIEAALLRGAESLVRRADMLNEYYARFGDPNGFRRDLARYRAVTPASVRRVAGEVFGEGRLDMRIVPAKSLPDPDPKALDARPEGFPVAPAKPPAPWEFTLSNGLQVTFVPKPGSGLFGAVLLAEGGESLVPEDRAGLATLTARLLTKGAAGRDASAFAEAAASLGASVRARASWEGLTVSLTGLSSRAEASLDLFADSLMRPSLSGEDFERERGLQLQEVRSRKDDPRDVGGTVADALMYGKADPRGRAPEGYEATLARLGAQDARDLLPKLLNPSASRLVVVGDLDPEALPGTLEKRFGSWRGAERTAGLPEPLAASKVTGLVLVDKPGAPQTYIAFGRPVRTPGDAERAERECVTTLFGGSFTSRLNQNLREKNGFTYGVGCGFGQEAGQSFLGGGTSVQTEVTAAAVSELRREFEALAGGDITPEELDKALKTQKFDLVTRAETTTGLLFTLAGYLSQGRPATALAADFSALDGVTLQGANGVARSGPFRWDDLLVVLVGDREALLPQLEKAGFTPVRAASAEGDLLP